MNPKNPYWLNFSPQTIRAIVVMQVAAIVGFFLFMVQWIFVKQPTTGIMTYHPWMMRIILIVFFTASAAWAPLVQNAHLSSAWLAASVAALAVAAICAILIVAGAAEDATAPTHVVVGTFLFALNIVIIDAIAYSARLIKFGIKIKN